MRSVLSHSQVASLFLFSFRRRSLCCPHTHMCEPWRCFCSFKSHIVQCLRFSSAIRCDAWEHIEHGVWTTVPAPGIGSLHDASVVHRHRYGGSLVRYYLSMRSVRVCMRFFFLFLLCIFCRHTVHSSLVNSYNGKICWLLLPALRKPVIFYYYLNALFSCSCELCFK